MPSLQLYILLFVTQNSSTLTFDKRERVDSEGLLKIFENEKKDVIWSCDEAFYCLNVGISKFYPFKVLRGMISLQGQEEFPSC